MSRSYRKNVWATDGQKNSKSRQWRKNLSNRILRRKLKRIDYEITNGCSYKTDAHSINSWDICDWKFKIDKPLREKVYGGIYIDSLEELLEEYKRAKRK